MLLLFPGRCSLFAGEALKLCACAVIPSLFPFMVLSPLLVESLPKGGRSGAAVCRSAFLIGMVTGFPVGAVTVAQMYRGGRLDKDRAERLLGVCSGAGPAFLIGYAGNALWGSAAAGWCYILFQTAASLVLYLWYMRSADKAPSPLSRAPETTSAPSLSLPAAIRGAVQNVLAVCGFVVFFSVLRGLLCDVCTVLQLPLSLSLLLNGGTEMTGGLAEVAACAFQGTPAGFVLSALFVGFGGVCVMMQVSAFAREAGLSMHHYLPQKLLCGGLCALFAAIAALLFG